MNEIEGTQTRMDLKMMGVVSNRPGGKAGVIRVAENLMRVSNRHHSVPYQLKAHALIVRRLVHYEEKHI